VHGRFVAYYRVSTHRQGRSGLGLEAQQQAVHEYLDGGRWKLLAEFTEVESGRGNDRPQLNAALSACRLHRATLIVAKLERLSRNAAFLLALRDSGVDFVAANMPEANRLTVGVLAVVAEHEREQISARTKGALAAARARGVRLGTPENLTAADRQRGSVLAAEARRRRAAQRALDVSPTIRELQAGGVRSLRKLGVALDERAIPAPHGGRWSAAQVRRLLRRLDALD